MPYSSVSELPDAVKKLPGKRQRQFMHVFNSVYSSCQSEGGSDCETHAFKAAWSAVKKGDNSFIVKAIRYFSELLDADDADTIVHSNTGSDDDMGLEKSLVYWYPGSSYSYAIDGSNNILDLGPTPPADMVYEGEGKHAKFALIIRRSNKTSAELIAEGDLTDIQAKAIDLVEDGKNEVRSVSVCQYIGKTFASRPVYQTVCRYDYISKSNPLGRDDRADISEADIERSSASINDLPDSAFAYIEPGGSKDESGKTIPCSKRHFPIHDANYVRDDLARANQSPFGKKALPKIIAAAKKFGVKIQQGIAAEHVKKEYLPYVCEMERDDFIYLLYSALLPQDTNIKYLEAYDKLHKSAEATKQVTFDVKLLKGDLSKGIVYGVVYAPYDTDTHGDWTSPEEIENAAHAFLPSALKNGGSGWTDVNHKDSVDDVEIVESYIAPCDFALNDENVKKGTWVIASKVNNAELRAGIDKGEITGYSLEGKAHKVDIDLNFAIG